ncbi:MAG: hypothetical protein ACUZ77_09290 [Candidatus Brocadiales bacterium]
MKRLYYAPPEEDVFNELKSSAIELWSAIGRNAGYIKDKVTQIQRMQNIGDNFMYIVAIFDDGNREKLAGMLSSDTRKAVRERMIDGEQPEHLNPF